MRKGKGELFDYLRENGGTAFVNNDDEAIKAKSEGIKNVSYGTHEGSITGKPAEGNSFLEVAITAGAAIPLIKTQLVGSYNLPNVLAAVTIGKHFWVADEKIKIAIEQYHPSNSRSQLINKGTNSIILDAYNANPTSMKAAIENFAKMQGDNKILLLGSMMELGEDSKMEHEELVKLIDKYPWKNVVLVGENFKNTGRSYLHFDTALEATKWLRDQHLEHSQLLVKGSRSMQMENVLETD